MLDESKVMPYSATGYSGLVDDEPRKKDAPGSQEIQQNPETPK